MKLKVFLMLALVSFGAYAADEPEKPRGLIADGPGAFVGYNLFAPLDTANTYLMDNQGRVIHTWESDYRPGNSAYLLENGNLLRAASFGRTGNKTFHGGGAGYRVEIFDWDGARLWDFIFASDDHLMHHDIEPMPNGNVLILAWEMKTEEEVLAAGRDPELLKQHELWSEKILEVKPKGPNSAEVVWEWHLWDHLIQDYDDSLANFGDVAAHPERVDVNPTGHWLDRISEEEMENLEALGYLGDDAPEDSSKKSKRRGGMGADWLHTNAIAYNPQLDQIVLSVLGNNELWILDHSTTTEEAKGHTGGRSAKGGDLLYRWGNPIAYRAGLEDDQRLFAQHDVRWIPEGVPGAGNILLFNNGRGRSDGTYSSVLEITTPINSDGTYRRAKGQAFGPQAPTWEYTAANKEDFYSSFISGARRLPNGNTLICEGASGAFFEVTAGKETLWRYVNPAKPPDRVIAKKSKRKSGKKKARPRKYNTAVYRISRYAPDYPGLKGRDLAPGQLLTDYVKAHPPKAPQEFEEKE